MWRKLTVALLLFTLAQTANAFSIEDFTDKTPADSITLDIEQSPATTSIVLVDDNEPEDSFSLPRLNRACASAFSNEVQTTPNYVFITQFFEPKLSAALFKNLANPPLQLNWYEQLSHQSSSNRLSGWKDGNTLYVSCVTYHP